MGEAQWNKEAQSSFSCLALTFSPMVGPSVTLVHSTIFLMLALSLTISNNIYIIFTRFKALMFEYWLNIVITHNLGICTIGKIFGLPQDMAFYNIDL